MKKRLLCLTTAVILACSMAGCGDVKDDSSAVDSTAAAAVNTESASNTTEESESESSDSETEMTSDEVMEKFGYNGTFDDDVFERIVSEVTIGDKTFSLPCKVSELGEDFELGGAGLIYKDTLTFSCVVVSGDDDTITLFGLCPFAWEYDEAEEKGINSSWSAGGINKDVDSETIEKYLGKPAKLFISSEGYENLIYYTDNHRLQFSFDKDKELCDFIIFI